MHRTAHAITIGLLLALSLGPAAFAAAPSNRPPGGAGPGGAGPGERPKPAKPKVYENAEHQFRFTAPDSWESVGTGCQGSVYNFALPPDWSAAKKDKDGSRTVVSDLFTVAVNPAKDPAADLDAAVDEIKKALQAEVPTRVFRPAERAKVAGGDAAVLVASIPPKEQGAPRRVDRHTIFLKDGKVFELILYSHQNTVGRSTGLVNTVARSFQWTGAGSSATTAPTKAASARSADDTRTFAPAPAPAAEVPSSRPAPSPAPAATAPAAPAAAASTSPASPATQTFTDERQTYFVTVPGDWRARKPPQGRGGMLLIGPAAGGKPGATPIFRVQNGQQHVGAAELTIDAFAQDVVRQVTGKAPDAVKIESARLGGLDARQFKVEKPDSNGVAVAMHYVIVLVQPRSFLFTYIQERDLYEAAEAKVIFDSVRWGPSATSRPPTQPSQPVK